MDRVEKDYIALIGFPARDTKHFSDGRVVESLGGVLFSALASAALAASMELDTVPISNIGRDVASEGMKTLADGGCRLEAVQVVDDCTQHSTILIENENERRERISGVLPTLWAEQIEPWLTARLIAVNFITGNELDLATFHTLRERYDGPIVMDFHTLGLRTLDDGRRVPRKRNDWAEWLQIPTIVQMNREEAETLAGCALDNAERCMAFARGLLDLGPQAVVITCAEDGAVGAERERNGFRTSSVLVQPVSEVVDTVGCGDVFLAGLAIGWMIWGALEPAMRLGAHAAALHTTYDGLTEMSKLREIRPR